MEQLQLHAPQKITASVADSALRVEMEALEPEQEGAPARSLWYKPMAWLGVVRPRRKLNHGLLHCGRPSSPPP